MDCAWTSLAAMLLIHNHYGSGTVQDQTISNSPLQTAPGKLRPGTTQTFAWMQGLRLKENKSLSLNAMDMINRCLGMMLIAKPSTWRTLAVTHLCAWGMKVDGTLPKSQWFLVTAQIMANNGVCLKYQRNL